jgi:TolB-like protein
MHRVLAFDRFALDLTRGRLRSGEQDIDLQPKSFAVLCCLVENAGRLVPKQEFHDAVWPNVVVSDDSLVQCIGELRRRLGDHDRRLIKTVSRRGYLLDVSISARDVPPSMQVSHAPALGAAAASSSSTLPLPDRPSIAVLPFANLDGDPRQQYFADGIVEDITTELSRFRELFVIARNSSFQYQGRPVDIRQIGRELGVRYVLEGSVRRSRDRIRVAAQLIDAENGGHLWAEKYEHDCGDVFVLQDAITRNVVGAMQPQILVGEGRRAAHKSPTDLDALDCCMRGMWHTYQRTPHDNKQAESWLRRSIELDPTLARAHTILARVLASRCWLGHSDDIDRDLAACRGAAERAVALDERDAAAHYAVSITELMIHRHERALRAAQQAIDLNPNFAHGYFALGETRLFMGQFTEALNPLTLCLRLSPHDPFASVFLSLIALAHYHLMNFKQAADYSERALQKRRTYIVLRTWAATLGQLGRTDEAHSALAEMEELKPVNVDRHWKLTCPYADPAHETHLLDGLRKARLSET